MYLDYERKGRVNCFSGSILGLEGEEESVNDISLYWRDRSGVFDIY